MLKPDHEKLTAYREQMGLTQKEVADILGILQSRVSEWETNKRSPGPENQRKLAKAYWCRVADFYSYDITALKSLSESVVADYLMDASEDKGGRARLGMKYIEFASTLVDYSGASDGAVTSASDLIHILEPIPSDERIHIPLNDEFVPIHESSSQVVQALATSIAEEVLVYGARSCGKTAIILLILLWYVENIPGIKIAICRSEEVRIGRTVLDSLRLLLKFPYARDPRNPFIISGGLDKPTAIRFSNDAEIRFIGLKDENALRGFQRHITFLNQGETEDSIDAYSSLIAGMVGSRAGPVRKPPGQDWVHRSYVDANPDMPLHWLFVRGESDDMETFHFTHKDHPHYYNPIEEEYYPLGLHVRESIRKAYPPGHMRDRMLDGICAGAEGLVLNCFDPAKHVLPKERQPRIEAGWEHYRTTDWGYKHPHVCLWISVDPEGVGYVWQEYAQTFKRDVEHADFIKNHSRGFTYTEHYADSENASGRAEFAANDLPTSIVNKDIRTGINTLNRLFAEDKLFIFEDLRINNDPGIAEGGFPENLIFEIAKLQYPAKKTATRKDDLPDENCDDDRVDALRYWAVGVHGGEGLGEIDLTGMVSIALGSPVQQTVF